MRRHTVFAVGLALTLPCVGVWAIDSQGTGNAAGEGTQLQAPANPTTPAPQDQAQPNAAPPTTAQPNAVPPNPAPPDQTQPNPAAANPAPPDQTQPAPAAPNAAPANPAPANPAPPDQTQPNPAPANPAQPGVSGQTSTTTTPVYYSPLQELASHNVDEIGELSQQIDQMRAAKRPDAVMVMYHMIRDHRLLADAAANALARRGDVAAPTITVTQPLANSPADTIRQDIQEHQQMAANLQQMVSSANTPEDKNIYQQALNATNKHLQWLQALDQGQQVAVGFFGPTTPLGQLSGQAGITTASATGYPQPTISQRVAGYQQQMAPRRATRHRRYRHGRYARYRRTHRYSRTISYR
jgi:hypothetical protein